MLTGTVRLWRDEGYGFIDADGDTYFCHWSQLPGDGFKSLVRGEMVQFDVEDSDRGPRAVNVVRNQPSRSFRDAAVNK